MPEHPHVCVWWTIGWLASELYIRKKFVKAVLSCWMQFSSYGVNLNPQYDLMHLGVWWPATGSIRLDWISHWTHLPLSIPKTLLNLASFKDFSCTSDIVILIFVVRNKWGFWMVTILSTGLSFRRHTIGCGMTFMPNPMHQRPAHFKNSNNFGWPEPFGNEHQNTYGLGKHNPLL